MRRPQGRSIENETLQVGGSKLQGAESRFVEGEVEALGSRGRGPVKETFTAEAARGIALLRPKRRISQRPARREEARPGSPRGAPPTGPSAICARHPEGPRASRVAVSETRDPPGKPPKKRKPGASHTPMGTHVSFRRLQVSYRSAGHVSLRKTG